MAPHAEHSKKWMQAFIGMISVCVARQNGQTSSDLTTGVREAAESVTAKQPPGCG